MRPLQIISRLSQGFAVFSLSAILLLFASAVTTEAQTVIISDGFSGTNGASLNGRTPDGVNLPGRSYTVASYLDYVGAQPGIYTGGGSPLPSATTGFNAVVFYDLSSNGGYTKPSLLTLSIDIQINTAANNVTPRGVGLGFYSISRANNSETEANDHFTGLTFRPDGALNLVVDGVLQAATVAPFGGFLTSSFYTLTYSVNTVSGSITAVKLNGTDYTGVFGGATTAGIFTGSLTNLAGFYGSTAVSPSFTPVVDNFKISSVAEPGMVELLFTGLGSWLVVSYWHQRQSRSAAVDRAG